jgi:hypothetical protein
VLAGDQLEIAIEQTEGLSFAQLRETYILGAQSAFEHGSEVRVADVIEAIELQAAGAQDLKTSVAAPGFVRHTEPSASRKYLSSGGKVGISSSPSRNGRAITKSIVVNEARNPFSRRPVNVPSAVVSISVTS